MPRIRILPADLCNKIAAGEVIERPASVVKELLENAIDAGGTEIRIEVLHGGKRLIRVADDGGGMDAEDAHLCFERHATSKLAHEKDLFSIRTLGFRGEALPSIASVSRVSLTTGLKNAVAGVSLSVEGGEVLEVRDAPAAGTAVEVRDLFYNTPARRKFMKSDTTETNHIIDTVTREALSRPGTGFHLTVDRREVLVLPRASGVKERLTQAYGDDIAAGLVEVIAEAGGLSLTAFVSKPDRFRKTRSHQLIFINGRTVKDSSVSHAVYKAYEGVMPPDRHPAFFLFLELDPGQVDFNVHPAKREVRFADKEGIYRFVSSRIRQVVRAERTDTVRQFTAPAGSALPAAPAYGTAAAAQQQVAETASIPYRPALPHLYLGDTFVAASGRTGLMIVDHHAAHERILYERFLKRVGIDPQPLLFPRQVRLHAKEHRVLLDNRELLAEFGFDLDDFGKDTLLVRALPAALLEADLASILADAAAELLAGVHPARSLREAVASRLACHSSVRGKTILNAEEFSRLLADLDEAEHPDQCPHGRPTRIFITLDDLKKMFRRK